MLFRAAIAVIGISVTAASADAQVATLHGPKTGEGVRDSSTATRRMTAALRTLVVAQDDWLKAHRRYGRALRRSGNGGVIVDLDAGITLDLMYVTTRGWTGRAMHRALPGRSCVVFVGDVPQSRWPRTRHDGAIPTRERTPACDAP
jgi:hypothetical protein